jgi:hypothetical protein
MSSGTWVSREDQQALRASQRRERFNERKPVFLDPDQRKIGLDIPFLSQQIEEKRAREAREKARSDAFDHMSLEHQRLLLESSEHERQLRLQVSQDTNRFRMREQNPRQCREYDIWRPDLLKLSQPARVGDTDPGLGISSGQIFQGEDLGISERLATQAAQRNEWNREQLREKEAIRRANEAEQLRGELIELQTQKRLVELEAQTEEGKSQVRRHISNENLDLAAEKRARDARANAVEQRLNEAELTANARSRVISEEMGARGGAPMEFRGLTVEEQKRVIEEQAVQMADNQRRKEEERERERQWNEYEASLRAQGDLNEAEWRRKVAREQEELRQARTEQDREFKRTHRYLNRELYGETSPEDPYHLQFGQSIR